MSNGKPASPTPETLAVVVRANGGKGHVRWHVLSDRQLGYSATACGEMADRGSAVPAREVPLNLRCNRKACRHNYPSFKPSGDRKVFK